MLRFHNGQFMAKSFHQSMKEQWQSMKCLPVLEYELNGDGECMVVNLEFTDQGITFNIDTSGMFEPRLFIGGDVVKPYPCRDDIFMLPFDPYFDSLDHYLQQIDSEIIDGFLIPNDLMAI